MKNFGSVMISVPFIFVMGLIIGIGYVDKIVFAGPEETQNLQMHLNKVMNELNNNNTEGAKMHLEGAQKMVAAMSEDNDNERANATSANLGLANNTEA